MIDPLPPSSEPSGRWAVAVFAHNIEAQIASCLQSLEQATDDHPLEVYVLENGSRDRTADAVLELANQLPFSVHLVRIPVGDKANAWNVFVHDIAARADIFFFVDGDVQVWAKAFDHLADGLSRHPASLAAASVPHSGRSAESIRQYILTTHELTGNLYAIRDDTIQRMRTSNLRMPTGYIGDDDLLSFLFLFNLDPTGKVTREGIAPCPEAHFYYPSLSPYSWHDWKLYYRRKARYSLRYFQDQMLFRTLKAHGIRAMPAHVLDLYRQASHLMGPIRMSPGVVWFDWLAKRRIHRSLQGSSSSNGHRNS